MDTATLEETSAELAADPKGNAPVKTFRHRNISANIFENESKANGNTFFAVTLQRTYKDGDEFKHSSSFTRDELPVAQHLVDQAWKFMLEAEGK